MVTRRVSEAEWQYRFFLANASGFQKCATSKGVSHGIVDDLSYEAPVGNAVKDFSKAIGGVRV